MSPELRIADNFSFPIELVTSTQAILARKRSGKSYTASVEAEEMLENGQQIAVIDPTSAWYGLRSSADRTGYAANGGGFNNAISRLRTLELIEGKGSLRLTPDFAQAVRR